MPGKQDLSLQLSGRPEGRTPDSASSQGIRFISLDVLIRGARSRPDRVVDILEACGALDLSSSLSRDVHLFFEFFFISFIQSVFYPVCIFITSNLYFFLLYDISDFCFVFLRFYRFFVPFSLNDS